MGGASQTFATLERLAAALDVPPPREVAGAADLPSVTFGTRDLRYCLASRW
ncbi:MAG: hypothetical protein ACRDYA_22235 [Egibacteraceae bacterium]